MKKGDAVYFVETNNSIRRATVFSANVDVVLTGDKDFLESAIEDPRIISVAEFLQMQ